MRVGVLGEGLGKRRSGPVVGHELVDLELAAVDGGRLRLQGDQELARGAGAADAGLRREGGDRFQLKFTKRSATRTYE